MAAAGSRPFIDQTPGDYGDFTRAVLCYRRSCRVIFDAFFAML